MFNNPLKCPSYNVCRSGVTVYVLNPSEAINTFELPKPSYLLTLELALQFQCSFTALYL